MSDHCAVTAVLITFNRAHLLGPAIDALLSQSGNSPQYELVVVDNNSTDDTRGVIEARMSRAGHRLRYVFEAQQGISFARNAGIANARADIIAFTDDDVRVTCGWVRAIKEALDTHPYVDCVGGRILPVWEAPPPLWLTERHWIGPLALQNYGDQPLVLDSNRPMSLAGANFAFRRQVFERIGGFPPEFTRAEDSAFLQRFWRSGYRALYTPQVTAYARVQAERLEKHYHRRWHADTGSYTRLGEELNAANTSAGQHRPFARVLGMPRFAINELAAETLCWFVHAVRGREADAFWHEGQIRELVAYMRASRALYHRNRKQSSSGGGAAGTRLSETHHETRVVQ